MVGDRWVPNDGVHGMPVVMKSSKTEWGKGRWWKCKGIHGDQHRDGYLLAQTCDCGMMHSELVSKLKKSHIESLS